MMRSGPGKSCSRNLKAIIFSTLPLFTFILFGNAQGHQWTKINRLALDWLFCLLSYQMWVLLAPRYRSRETAGKPNHKLELTFQILLPRRRVQNIPINNVPCHKVDLASELHLDFRNAGKQACKNPNVCFSAQSCPFILVALFNPWRHTQATHLLRICSQELSQLKSTFKEDRTTLGGRGGMWQLFHRLESI